MSNRVQSKARSSQLRPPRHTGKWDREERQVRNPKDPNISMSNEKSPSRRVCVLLTKELRASPSSPSKRATLTVWLMHCHAYHTSARLSLQAMMPSAPAGTAGPMGARFTCSATMIERQVNGLEACNWVARLQDQRKGGEATAARQTV
ncbi:hypothetical protein LX36DRAFT_212428 [Colletotrichum falcatum]|nr:hypothetical protein LX36DRAFT_212428 [Colletotrichum falcatum]